jgi:hypothetical protein
MKRNRIAALAAVPVLALVASFAAVPAASADVGDVLIHQDNAAGQVISTQDYVVANLTPETILDAVTPGATSVTVTNDTLEPINVTGIYGDPEVGTGLTLKVEICMNAGFCMVIVDTELPGGV